MSNRSPHRSQCLRSTPHDEYDPQVRSFAGLLQSQLEATVQSLLPFIFREECQERGGIHTPAWKTFEKNHSIANKGKENKTLLKVMAVLRKALKWEQHLGASKVHCIVSISANPE